jgi:hypothetical protein
MPNDSSIGIVWFPLIPLPIIEAILLLAPRYLGGSKIRFPLIPLPIIEAIVRAIAV